jgi:hypothetical protein
MCNTPVEVQFTSAGCLNYPCRTPVSSQLARVAWAFWIILRHRLITELRYELG